MTKTTESTSERAHAAFSGHRGIDPSPALPQAWRASWGAFAGAAAAGASAPRAYAAYVAAAHPPAARRLPTWAGLTGGERDGFRAAAGMVRR